MRIAILALTFALLAGCADEGPIDFPLFELDGFVVDASFRPVPGALVTIEDHPATAITNENGEFRFGLPEGTYRLQASKDGATGPYTTVELGDNEEAVALSLEEGVEPGSTEDAFTTAEFTLYADCILNTPAQTVTCNNSSNLDYTASGSDTANQLLIQADLAGQNRITATHEGTIIGTTQGQGPLRLEFIHGETWERTMELTVTWEPLGTLAEETQTDGIGVHLATTADFAHTLLFGGLQASDF